MLSSFSSTSSSSSSSSSFVKFKHYYFKSIKKSNDKKHDDDDDDLTGTTTTTTIRTRSNNNNNNNINNETNKKKNQQQQQYKRQKKKKKKKKLSIQRIILYSIIVILMIVWIILSSIQYYPMIQQSLSTTTTTTTTTQHAEEGTTAMATSAIGKALLTSKTSSSSSSSSSSSYIPGSNFRGNNNTVTNTTTIQQQYQQYLSNLTIKERFLEYNNTGKLIRCEWDIDCIIIPTTIKNDDNENTDTTINNNSFLSSLFSSFFMFSTSSSSSLQQQQQQQQKQHGKEIDDNNSIQIRTTTTTTTINDFKTNNNTKLLIRNTLSFDRTICGVRVPKDGGIIEFIPSRICTFGGSITYKKKNIKTEISEFFNTTTIIETIQHRKRIIKDIKNQIPLRIFRGTITPSITNGNNITTLPPIVLRRSDKFQYKNDSINSYYLMSNWKQNEATRKNYNPFSGNDNNNNNDIDFGFRIKQPSISKFDDCSVSCYYQNNVQVGTHYQASIDDLPFRLSGGMESSEYYNYLRILPNAYKYHMYYGTTNFQSDIPMPYFSFSEYPKLQTTAVPFSNNNATTIIKGASFLARNCNSNNGREKIVEDLIILSLSNSKTTYSRNTNIRNTNKFVTDDNSNIYYLDRGRPKREEKYYRNNDNNNNDINNNNKYSNNKKGIVIHSLSSCLHNQDLDDNLKDHYNITNLYDKTYVMSKYLFHLAFENSNEIDYITEKIWGSLSSGTIPIYYGSSNIVQHVPYNSIINVNDFNTTKELYNHLIKVANNETLYNTYHQWRTEQIINNTNNKFYNKYKFTNTHSLCRTCKWAYSKKYGLGWNHQQQEITNLYISRNICLKTTKTSSSTTRTTTNNTNTNNNNNNNGLFLLKQPFKEEYYKIINHNQQQQQHEPVLIVPSSSNSINRTTYTTSNQEESCFIDDTNRWIDIDVRNTSTSIDNDTTSETTSETSNDNLIVSLYNLLFSKKPITNNNNNNNNNNNGILRRALYPHDGVLDMKFEYIPPKPKMEETIKSSSSSSSNFLNYLFGTTSQQKKQQKEQQKIQRQQGNDNNKTYIFKMILPIETNEIGMVNYRHYILQNLKSRITILFSHNLNLFMNNNKSYMNKDDMMNHFKQGKVIRGTLPSKGVLGIPLSIKQLLQIQQQQQQQQQSTIVSKSIPRRNNNISKKRSRFEIRIIIEDLDLVHADGYKHENYFGSIMTQDFFQPLELYQIQN